MPSTAPIPIIIVGFRNPEDILDALLALSRAEPDPAFSVHICENGGSDAFAALVEILARTPSLTVPAADEAAPAQHAFRALRSFRLAGNNAAVTVGDAGENLGYGGGINRWLSALSDRDFPSILVLNPDAAPAPNALGQMKRFADQSGKGMVTGRIVLADAPDRVQTRGIRFRRWIASTQSVDRLAPSSLRPDPADVERRVDALPGAALYVTRACLNRIGPMREDFFLYFEDLDWGIKAKRCCGLGYAYDAVVVHKGGTTIGSGHKAVRSPLSVYLEFRNCLLFVRDTMPLWFPWAIGMRFLRAIELLVIGRPDAAWAAVRGIGAGILGRSGRPDAMLQQHLERH